MSNEIRDMAGASAAVARLPETLEVELGSGHRVKAGRLSWLQFEVLWPELAGLLTTLLRAVDGEGADGLPEVLAGAPACVLRLVTLGSDLAEGEAAELPFDDVLAVAAAVVELNFVNTRGIHGFFAAVGRLSAPESASGRTPTP